MLTLLHSVLIWRIGSRLPDYPSREPSRISENDDMSTKVPRRTLVSMTLVFRFYSAAAIPKLLPNWISVDGQDLKSHPLAFVDIE